MKSRGFFSSWVRHISLAMCVVFCYVHIAYSAIEPVKNFWQERRKVVEELSAGGSNSKKNFQENITLLAKLPRIQTTSFLTPNFQIPTASSLFSPNPLTPISQLSLSLPLGYTNFKSAQIPKNWKPKDGLIVYIQDVHLNAEAQKNIGSAVQELINQGQVDLVALEGGFGEIDITKFREFEDQDTVRKVADYMLREHKISGPLHTAFTSRKSIPTYIGVDDETLYRAHVQAYKDSAPQTKSLKKKLTKKQIQLEKEKTQGFNQDLFDFDKQVQAYRKGDLKLGGGM